MVFFREQHRTFRALLSNNTFTLLFFFLGPTCTIYSQIKSGEVIYSMELNFTPTEKTEKTNVQGNQTLMNMIRKSQMELAEVKGVLKFNSTVSFFFKEVPMQNDYNPSLNVALSLLGISGGGYYVDKDEEVKLEITEQYGKKYLIEEKAFQKEDWTIKPEMKKIGDYLVYKAVTKEIIENSKGRFVHPIIAWFAPEIPFSFGPMGYSGLPGLILELEVQSNFPSKYIVESVSFKETDLKINKPEGERITPEESRTMARKAMGNLSRN